MKLSFVSAALLISVLSTDAQHYGSDHPPPMYSEPQAKTYSASSNYDPQVPVPQQSNYNHPPNPVMESYYDSGPSAHYTQPLPAESVPAAPPSPQYYAGPASFPPQQVSSTAYTQSASAPLAPQVPCAGAPQVPCAGAPRAPSVPRAPCACAQHASATGVPRAPCACAQRAPATGVPHAPYPYAPRAPAAGVPRVPAAGAKRAPCPCASRGPAAGAPRAPCACAQRAPATGVPRAPCACARAPCACAQRAPATGVPRAPCACVRAPCACARVSAAGAPRVPAASAPRAPAKRVSAQYTRAALPHLGLSASLSSNTKLPGTSELPVSEGPESAASGTPGNPGEKTSASIDQTSQKSSLNKPQEVEIKASH